MEVLSCSDVQYVGESNCPDQSSETKFLYSGESNCLEHGKRVQVSDITRTVDDFVLNGEGAQKDRPGEDQGRVNGPPTSEGLCSGTSDPEHKEKGQELLCDFHGFQQGSPNAQKQHTEPCTASGNMYPVVDKIEGELPSSNRDGESRLPKAEWSEQDETVALWVKWRGKWQAGIRCARADCPLSILKARPTHDRKKYFVVFFPQKRNHSWADMQLVRPINEFPEPIAYRTHYRGVEMVKDLSIPRRFVMQKLAVAMLNVSDQLHTEAVIESARKVAAWKEFAMDVSRCKGYSDLGRMLLKLQSMILQRYIDPGWLRHSFGSWAQRCQNAQSAESVETLKEELEDSILWNEVEALWDAPVQPELGFEWRSWKQEVVKWFSTSQPMPSGGDVGQRNSDDSMTLGLQISRKRPKLEVRRAEMHSSQVEATASHEVNPQTNTVDINSGYFNSQGLGNASTLVPEPCKDRGSTIGAAPSEYPGSVADRWDEIVVEAGNPEFIRTTEVEDIPVDGGSGGKSWDPGNKYRQCLAFIETKGRQCVRWANDGGVYCCVHLATQSLGKISKAGQSPVDAPMCEGTTNHGTKCKHKSLYGSSFCKKHRLHNSQCLMDVENPSTSSGNKLKRKHMEMISTSETAYCKEIISLGEVKNPIQKNSVSIIQGDTVDGNSLIKKSEHCIKSYNSAELLCCIGSCHRNNNAPCLDRAKLHSLYCEKHLPSWLKRARNGKSRIISKEVFTDLLRNCSSQKQKLHLHLACELLYGFIKSILYRRNPVPRETQLQWILSESSKDICVGECLMKLVSREREKLRGLWDFDIDKYKLVSSSGAEEKVCMPAILENSHSIQKTVKCKICTEEFSDDQVLGVHWMDIHKKEAQWLFRGYVCAICTNSFTNKKVLETHVRKRHGVQFLEQCILFQCIPCGNHFMNPEQLWLHVLSVHCMDFRMPTVAQQDNLSASQASRPKLVLGNNDASGNNSDSKGGLRRFICRFCGLKFDLLPDLGRHHQAAHMDPNSISHFSQKRGTCLNPYKLKSGRLSRPRFKSSLGAASYRIRNRNTLRMKKRFQVSSSVRTEGASVQTQVTEVVGLGRLIESQRSAVANILFSEIQKTKPRPNNLDILSVARSTCCKISLQDTLEKHYGVLPERLYLKAAKLCSELNIQVEWHQEEFICPKGCKPVKDPLFLSPLMPLPSGFIEPTPAKSADPTKSEEWEMDECHYILESQHIKSKPMRKAIVLCEDVSFGRESVGIACVVDEDHIGSLLIIRDEGSDVPKTSCPPMPWEGFSYVTERLLDRSLGLDTKSSQLGCACPHSTCYPETCDHVYLFDNDYEDAMDIYGKPTHGRFPYDEKGRIILEEGYQVYECNSMCSCDRTCRNRVLQNGVQVKLEIFKTENKGWAVRAGEAISRGTFVCEYIGEVLNDQEANKRGERYDNEGCSYLYDIDAHMDDMSRLTEGAVPYVIDARRYGNVSRFINHSCSPNLMNYQVLVESMDCQLAHVGLYATRDINIGEELAYDYRYKLLPGGGYPCHCDAPNCRGRLC